MNPKSVCVIGAGPVGIWTASRLVKNGLRVELLEAGYQDRESELLNRTNYKFLTPSAIPEHVHQVGGGSNLWMSRIGEFLPSDFETIPEVRKDSWPLQKNDLDEHYRDCYEFLVQTRLLDEEFLEKFLKLRRDDLPEELDFRLFRFGEMDAFNRLLGELKEDTLFSIKQGHRVNSIASDHQKDQVIINCELENSEQKDFIYDYVVVAAGAMQSASLLAKSPTFSNYDGFHLVGKGLMEHFDGYVGRLRIKRNQSAKIADFLLTKDRKLPGFNQNFGVGVRFSDQKNSSNGFVSAHFEFTHYQPRYCFDANALEIRHQRMSKWKKELILKTLFQIERLLVKAFSLIRQFYLRIIDRIDYSIWLKGEELLNEESKLEFSGNNVLYAHRISEKSSNEIRRILLELSKVFKENSMGKITYYKSLMKIDSLFYLRPNWHPMGTLRASSLNETVCDEKFRFGKSDRIFVASAATFPSGSNSNPTFTAMATGGFIADYLHNLVY